MISKEDCMKEKMKSSFSGRKMVVSEINVNHQLRSYKLKPKSVKSLLKIFKHLQKKTNSSTLSLASPRKQMNS